MNQESLSPDGPPAPLPAEFPAAEERAGAEVLRAGVLPAAEALRAGVPVQAGPSLGSSEENGGLSSLAPPKLAGGEAIDVDHLCKEFRVFHRSYASLKSHASALAGGVLRRQVPSGFDVRHALKDVSFSIGQGESVALIGRNGSGKSTLLSILSRVYLPTSGTASLHGRMMSLLELGAGFDPELTGEQNVFFNGVILGLREEQVAARYGDILDFAELDRSAMDLPVRMYSSGMQLRLGFAIAVHLDADILLLDEGLAVGDEGFQEKCFARLKQSHAEGRTLLMVTHELDHVERLAERVIWLDRGVMKMDGSVADVLPPYRAAFHAQEQA